MKRISYFPILMLSVAVCIMTSCDDIGSNLEPIPGFEYESVTNEEIAKALAHINPDKEICSEVHAAVSEAISLGLDESYYFTELLGNGNKITKPSNVTRELQAKLNSLPTGNSIKELFAIVAKDSDYLKNYQIYWPYSANWDGNEQPTITYQTDPTVQQEQNVGYRIAGDKIEEVTVNEEYARKHPVWIINYNPIPYEEYPDFAVQNWTETEKYNFSYMGYSYDVSDRILVYPKTYLASANNTIIRPEYPNNRYDLNFHKDVLSLYLREVTFKEDDEEKHSLFSGGVHCIVSMGVTDDNEIHPEDIPENERNQFFITEDIEVDAVSYRFVFLRSELKPGTRKIIDGLISWKWQYFENHMLLSWGKEEIPQKIYSRLFVEYVYPLANNQKCNNYYFGRCFAYDSYTEDFIEYYRDRDTYSSPIEGEVFSLKMDVTKGESVPPWRQ